MCPPTKPQSATNTRPRKRVQKAPDEEAVCAKLLSLLDRRGAAGATRKQLLHGAFLSVRQSALKTLIARRAIHSAKIGRVERFVLPRHVLPVERVYETLDGQLPQRLGPLLTVKDFELVLRTAGARANLPAAVDALVKERRLLPLDRAGAQFYLHLPSIQSRLQPAPDSVPAEPEVREAAVVMAWQKIRSYSGFEDVAISELQEAAGVPRDTFSRWLAKEARAGRWILSTGDPLHATDAQRAAAMVLDGATYLFARRTA